jgi:hypothetical protein
MHVSTRSFIVSDAKLRTLMLDAGQNVHTETWQGMDIRNAPAGAMRELLNVTRGRGPAQHRVPRPLARGDAAPTCRGQMITSPNASADSR